MKNLKFYALLFCVLHILSYSNVMAIEEANYEVVEKNSIYALNNKDILRDRLWEDIFKNNKIIKSTYPVSWSSLFIKFAHLMEKHNIKETNLVIFARSNRRANAEARYNIYDNLRSKNIEQNTVYIIHDLGHLRNLKSIFKNSDISFFYRDDIWSMVLNENDLLSKKDKEAFSKIKPKLLTFDRSVNLNNSITSHSDSSNIMGIVNTKFKDYWRLSGYTEFNPHAGHGQKNQVRLSYKKPYGKQNKIFNTSYRFSRGEQEEVDISGVLPFNNRTSLIGKVNYSFNNRRSKTEDVLERMIGIEYESCCYGMKFVIREYWNGTKKDDAIYFEFLPKGIATSSNTTAELLREGILGYQDKFEY